MKKANKSDLLLMFSYAHVAFLIIYSLVFTVSVSSLEGILTDKEALLSFKSRIIDDPSGALSSWNDSSDVCKWTGVSCDKRLQRISSLNLQGLGLSGPVNPQLGNISFLQALHLQDNHFSGVLPDQIGHLEQLQVLNVSSNNLEGTVPANITKCRELEVLDLSANKIYGRIPSDLDTLRKLQTLKLGHNQLVGVIPPSLGNISSLTILDLGTNTLSGPIPEDLGQLRSLQYLHLALNNITGTVPPPLYNLSSLTHFDLASNNLRGVLPADIGVRLQNLLLFHFCYNEFTGSIPPSLHNITNIQSIRMSHNFFVGTVPPGLGHLPDLKMYNIGFNQIVSTDLSFITSLTNSSKLWFLAIDENFLEGVIPYSVGNLSRSLQKLYMGGNLISGKIPASIGQLSNLTLLNVSHNLISGEIPVEISQLRVLQMLGLAGNRLVGRIPEALGALSKLNKLELYANNLGGSIPTVLSKFKSLLTLDLSNNLLNGSIPGEVFTIASLNSVSFSRNQFSGPLPEDIGSMVNAINIDISYNSLEGEIPDSIGNCKSLQTLSLSRNSFSGEIPSKLGTLKGLQNLDLSSNQLSGSIPANLGKLQALQSLNLSFNNLEGEIPKDGIFRNLSGFHLQGNPGLCMTSTCDRSSHLKLSLALRVLVLVVGIVMLCVLLGLFWLFFLRRKKHVKVLATSDSFSKHHKLISYEELRRATSNFDPINLVGVGSYGAVYKGILSDGMAVAAKVLNLGTTGASKSFLAECDAMRNVRHRNLVRLVTSCSSLDYANNSFLAIVYEFMSNGNLDDWVRGNRRHADGSNLNLYKRLHIAIDVASAVDYMHNDCDVAVVHCDLKPCNVLLDEDMTAKVGDFGLSKLLIERSAEQSSFTSTRRIKGSIGYIPPEYGLGGRPSTRGDVYSYGIMLLELLTGKNPTNEIFEGQMSLERWVRTAFPDNIMEVVDVDILLEHDINIEGRSVCPEKQQECITAVVKLALACAMESPEARITMRDAAQQLNSIQTSLLKPYLNPKI